MVAVGMAITLLNVTVLVVCFCRYRRAKLPSYGWLALIGMLIAELGMFRGLEPIATYFTPVAWTCYILLVDAAVLAITRRSRLLNSPLELLEMALLSIPLWLIFETYNLRLANWMYVGVPRDWTSALVGYGWSFATITPAILETADLIEAFSWFKPTRALRLSVGTEHGLIVCGLICLSLPLLLPKAIAAYCFGLVWAGFVLLLDPINHRLKLPSLLGDLANGRPGRLYSLLLAGWACGFFWEFWNYWASAKWHYIFPILQGAKIFEMPAPGYLGFLPFALECFVMYVTASWLLHKFLFWATREPPIVES